MTEKHFYNSANIFTTHSHVKPNLLDGMDETGCNLNVPMYQSQQSQLITEVPTEAEAINGSVKVDHVS